MNGGSEKLRLIEGWKLTRVDDAEDGCRDVPVGCGCGCYICYSPLMLGFER